jgi:aryl-alcohol dehydrogenase-like predicted oxidoreductase
MSKPSTTTRSLGGEITLGGDLTVHRLGFGAMRITGPGIWGPPADRAGAVKLIRHVVESGVNFIDTADSYGPYVSEEIIAEALAPYPAGVVIATKGGLRRTGPNQWPVDARPERLRECVEGSLRRLKLERIDLYQLHRIDPRTPLEESLGALKRMQEAGKIRHIGLSEVTPAEIEEAEKIVPIVSIQNRYSLADRRHEETLKYCERRGIGFLPWYPYAGGKLLKPDHPSAQSLTAIAARHNATIPQLSLAWLLQRSPVMLPIPGTSKVAHLEENVAAASLQLSVQEWAEVERAAQA